MKPKTTGLLDVKVGDILVVHSLGQKNRRRVTRIGWRWIYCGSGYRFDVNTGLSETDSSVALTKEQADVLEVHEGARRRLRMADVVVGHGVPDGLLLAIDKLVKEWSTK